VQISLRKYINGFPPTPFGPEHESLSISEFKYFFPPKGGLVEEGGLDDNGSDAVWVWITLTLRTDNVEVKGQCIPTLEAGRLSSKYP
jgi:hypothetical protein